MSADRFPTTYSGNESIFERIPPIHFEDWTSPTIVNSNTHIRSNIHEESTNTVYDFDYCIYSSDVIL